jgi:hypothetical protein
VALLTGSIDGVLWKVGDRCRGDELPELYSDLLVVPVFQLRPSRRSHIADATIAALTSHEGSVYYVDLSLNGGLGSQI